MEKEKPVRIVPSGKVYRQKFDAEVQLVQALERQGTLATTAASIQLGAFGDRHGTVDSVKRSVQREGTIPLVRDLPSLTGTGLLTERQRTWTEGFPNESHLENPVLYKFYTDDFRERLREPEASVASKEVRGLPDVLAPAKTGSDIIERIAESRRQRHDASIEDLHQELGIISSELEPQIAEAGEKLIVKLQENDVVTDKLMAQIEDNKDLVAYTLPELEDLWQEVAKQSTIRQGWIHNLDVSLAGLEDGRMLKVKQIFQTYTENLEKIAHLMPPDLQRLMDKESQLINQTVLSNRRAYADLKCRLLMSDIEREKRLHIQWKKRVNDWKRLHTDTVVEQFRQFMESVTVMAPPGVLNVLNQMKMEQRQLNLRRIDLVNTLREMKPPTSTKTGVYHWNQQITEVTKEIDDINQQFFNQLYLEYEKVCQDCLGHVEEIKMDLIERKVCTEEQAKQVVDDKCLPLVGERQAKFERSLEEMDKTLEEHNSYVLGQLKSLFKFCQGAAHVWDVHEIGLAKQERSLQENLEDCRHSHDTENQDKEANLDIVMDRMRQDATEQALKDNLRRALDMLGKIKEAYAVFHSQQSGIVAEYPQMVEDELQRYDKAVCKFFMVNRRHPDDRETTSSEPEEKKDSKEDLISPRGKSVAKRKKKAMKPSSRASSRGSDIEDTNKSSSPLPLAVSEVLSTAKGSTFYVLTVAGEHGIPPEDQTEAPKQEPAEGTTFLTETPPSSEHNGEGKPSYIVEVDVPDSLLIDIKKMIRMNFLEHLEEWWSSAVDRSRSVVAAKTEELNSELDLRLHLHQPRARRAELDVHNVRAAELVMHSERVSRHCKGIQQALTDLKTRFNDMTQEHNDLADKYRQDIEALEGIFVNATKSSKLVALSNQLVSEQDKYMDIIRASLRDFRQHVDDTLQMLRESNARFIKSFKVFSDGGNFCPEEIDDFRKKLEKMSQKIDMAEGFVLSDLEGMESKRLDQASKVTAEFEDRFKHHMIDLLFMEKIARWLTNTQVKIKSEVASSNSQAQRLAQILNDLERRIDACERPNLDKESISPVQLNDSLPGIFESVHERSVYLKCLKEAQVRPPSAALQGNPALGARVGFVSETTVPQITRPGRQAPEDPSVGVIKNILKTQKSRFGKDAEMDGETSAQIQVGLSQPPLNSAPTSENHEKKSRQSRLTSDNESRSKKSAHGTSNGPQSEAPKRAQSGSLSLPVGQRLGSVESLHTASLMSFSMASVAFSRRKTQHVIRRISKNQKYEKKYMVFGEKEEPGEDTHFLGLIQRLLREACDGLLSAAEIYYRQKGNRMVTRPQALQETFEQCAEILVQKLQSYHTQADEYHNQCLQEFRGQLIRLEQLVASVPGCVIRELIKTAIAESHTQRAHKDALFRASSKEFENKKLEHQRDLRPGLGHPQHSEELANLCEEEAARNVQSLEALETHTRALQDLAVTQGKNFIDKLARTSEQLFLQFDNMLTVDDVNKGRVPPTKYPTSELIRRKNAGLPLEDLEDKSTLPRGKATWPGVPKSELVVPGLQPEEKTKESVKEKKGKSKTIAKADTTASVTTAKTTLGHSATGNTRDKAYEEYKNHFGLTLESIEAEKQKNVIAEQRWFDSWLSSVQKVRDLY